MHTKKVTHYTVSAKTPSNVLRYNEVLQCATVGAQAGQLGKPR